MKLIFLLSLLLVGVVIAGPSSYPTGLVSHWEADGDATDSVGSNDGTFAAGTYVSDGLGGQAFDLDGNDDYVNVGDPVDGSLDFGAADDFTISLRFKADSFPTEGNRTSFITKRDGFNAGYSFDLVTIIGETRIGGIAEDVSGNVQVSVQTGAGLSTGTWYNAVIVYDRTADTMTHYLNGALYETVTDISTVTGSLANTKSFYIGKDKENNRFDFDGAIDDVAVWNRALNTSEIQGLYEYYEEDVVPELENNLMIFMGLISLVIVAVALVSMTKK